MLIKLSNLLLLLFTSLLLSGQCPSNVTLSTNNNCFYLSWPTGNVPSPLPATMSYNGSTFNLSSGVGTVASPAIYSKGNCPNSTPNTFSGVITINGQICNYAAGILPVVYEDYKVVQEGNQTFVKWTTYTEINVSRYEVYLSYDAVNWSKVRTLNSLGNTKEVIYYSCNLDVSKHQPIFYVRVKEVDMDGMVQEFDILEARNNTSSRLHCYPNPTHDFVYLDVDVQSIMSVKDVSNREVISQVLFSDHKLDLSQVPGGLYFVLLTNGVASEVVKVMKY